MPGFVIGDGTQSNGRDKNEKKIISTSQRNLLTATKIALFAFQFWGLARPPSPASTPAADDDWRQGSEDALPNDESCELPERRSSTENQVDAC